MNKEVLKVQEEIKELENQLKIRDEIKQKESDLASLKILLDDYKVDYKHRASYEAYEEILEQASQIRKEITKLQHKIN
jgi:hypothetical protein